MALLNEIQDFSRSTLKPTSTVERTNYVVYGLIFIKLLIIEC